VVFGRLRAVLVDGGLPGRYRWSLMDAGPIDGGLPAFGHGSRQGVSRYPSGSGKEMRGTVFGRETHQKLSSRGNTICLRVGPVNGSR
jgi:hypothetical protein